MGDVLSRRALNRTLLARQFLLQREHHGVSETIEHLVGMQAQVPSQPYTALWSRIEGFDPLDLSALVANRDAVRGPFMRGTLHLMTASDALGLRPVVQPVLERAFATGSPFGRNLAGIDLDAVRHRGRELLDARPRTSAELGRALHEHWPDYDANSLAYAITYTVPVVQIPPRGTWGASSQPTWATTAAWLGEPVGTDSTPDAMILRYLAAFGPASTRDVQAWSGLTSLASALERLRPRLRTFRTEAGRELFDVEDGVRHGEDMPAPPRFLPEYDNILLGHADRTRIVSDEHRKWFEFGRGPVHGSFLLDGFVAGGWSLTRQKDAATLTLEPISPIAMADESALSEEGARLLSLLAGDVESCEVVLRRA